MNLFYGEFVEDEELQGRLELLASQIAQTKAESELSYTTVIDACERLLNSVEDDFLISTLEAQGMSKEKAAGEIAQARKIMSRDNLMRRVRLELGESGEVELPGTSGELKGSESADDYDTEASDGAASVKVLRRPLGTLFHIAAGNLDVLPAFSVIEGLLSGNINILKLPGGVDDLSITVLKYLTELEPKLIPYIYVFDFPSSDVALMQKMAETADAVVVWGGTEAIRSVRTLAEANTKIIEWGHKLSFAYVSGEVSDAELCKVAYNICDTNGVLCSSCQGIFVDSEKMDDVLAFSRRFFDILKAEAVKHDPIKDTGIRAQKSLEMYTEAIEAMTDDSKAVLCGDGCGIIIKKDSTLEPSYGFRNIWIKPLPRYRLVSELSQYKGYLQTAALLCPAEERDKMVNLLLRSGVNRITDGIGMSQLLDIEPHDGLLPLREYTKLVTIQK